MKNFIIVLLAFLNFSASAIVIGGTEVGNGGDSVSQEFITLGYRIAGALALNPIDEVDASLFLMTVSKTQVFSKNELKLQGEEVTAVNFPNQNKIYVHSIRWKKTKSFMTRAYLVLHEYLWMMGIDDTNYKVSHRLVLGQLPSEEDYLLQIQNQVAVKIKNDQKLGEYAQFVEEVDDESLSFKTLFDIKNYFYTKGIKTFAYHTVYQGSEVYKLERLLKVTYGTKTVYIAIFSNKSYILACTKECTKI